MEIYRFEKKFYNISSDAQTVLLTLQDPGHPGIVNPSKWRFIEKQYEISTSDNPTDLEDSFTQWDGQLASFEEYVNSNGYLTMKIDIPSNNSDKYRALRIFAHDDNECYAFALIVQYPKGVPVPDDDSNDVMRIRVNGNIYTSL